MEKSPDPTVLDSIRRGLFWAGLFAAVLVFGTACHLIDVDLWHRLALGRYLFQERHWPDSDPFNYLARPGGIFDHEWGCGPLFYGLHQIGGEPALVLLKLLLLGITVGLIVAANRRPEARTHSGWFAFYLLVIAVLSPSFASTIRCMTFTHVFFAAYLYWLEKGYAIGRYPCFVFPLTMMVWANLHGGFVAGFALLGLYALAEWRRPSALRSLGWIGAGTFLATLINPYGLVLWPITLRSLFHPRPNFWEWAPVPWGGDWGAMLAYKILVLVILGIGVRRFWRKREWDHDFWAVAALAGAVVISSQHLRHASLFAILAGVYGVRLWEGTPISASTGPMRGWKGMVKRGLPLAALTVGLVVLLQGWRQSNFQAKPDPVTMPMAAVAQLKHSGRRGHLLVSFNYGSYALWELSPAMQVSADGRYDLVCDFAVHQAVCDFFEGKPGWEVFLKEHPPAAILAPVEALVIPPLLASGQWQETFRDAQAVVLLPKEEVGKRN